MNIQQHELPEKQNRHTLDSLMNNFEKEGDGFFKDMYVRAIQLQIGWAKQNNQRIYCYKQRFNKLMENYGKHNR